MSETKPTLEPQEKQTLENEDMKQSKPVMGQPTKYKPEYCNQLIEYFESIEPIRIREEKCVNPKTGEYFIKEIEEPNAPPTLYGFARRIGVGRDRLGEWAKKHPEFKQAFNHAKAIQAEFIIEGVMTNRVKGSFPHLMMKNNHNWTDKNESTVSHHMTLESLVGQSFNSGLRIVEDKKEVIEHKPEEGANE
jgi:hypothetical protein